MSKTVLLRAPVFSLSGYGSHARQIARWLLRHAALKHDLDITVEPLRWGNTHWIVDTEAEDGLIGEMLQHVRNQKPYYDITIQLQLPNEWNPFLGSVNIGVTAGVETDRCNPAWIDAVNSMTAVVVPSEFTKQTFMNSGEVSVPILTIPESFPDVMLEEPEAIDLGLTTKFNFLVFGQITGNNVDNDRKNIPYTLKWLAERFSGNPDVGIVVKTNFGANTKFDRQNMVDSLGKLVHSLDIKHGPRFYLCHGLMTDKELQSLYTNPAIKTLVTTSKGEGFCIPALEAAACGLPVMATNWSAHTEFLQLTDSSKFDYVLEDIHPTRVDNNIFMQGAKWANVLEADFKEKVNNFYQQPGMLDKETEERKTRIREQFCFSSVCSHWDKELEPYFVKEE